MIQREREREREKRYFLVDALSFIDCPTHTIHMIHDLHECKIHEMVSYTYRTPYTCAMTIDSLHAFHKTG
jgi:hypothetical protein